MMDDNYQPPLESNWTPGKLLIVAAAVFGFFILLAIL